jgi:imidazolonepropionase-like amidohydrolase
MVKYGLTPQQALACSVINGPAFFQQSDSYGSVAENKKADLLLLHKNPLLAIENTQSIDAVVRKGKYLNRKQLDAMLQSIEEEVKKLK